MMISLAVAAPMQGINFAAKYGLTTSACYPFSQARLDNRSVSCAANPAAISTCGKVQLSGSASLVSPPLTEIALVQVRI